MNRLLLAICSGTLALISMSALAESIAHSQPTSIDEVRDKLTEEASKIGEKNRQAEEKYAQLQQLKERLDQLPRISENSAELELALRDVVMEAQKSTADLLSGDQLSAIGTIDDFLTAYKKTLDAAGNELVAQDLQDEIDKTKAESDKMDEDVARNILALTILGPMVKAAADKVDAQKPEIFQKVSAAYERAFNVANTRESARQEKARAANSHGGDQKIPGGKAGGQGNGGTGQGGGDGGTRNPPGENRMHMPPQHTGGGGG